MTQPNRTLVEFVLFLAAVAAVCGFLYAPLAAAFATNSAFNSVILALFAVGVVVISRQVLALKDEVAWVSEFRQSRREAPVRAQPRLLLPMAKLLASRDRNALKLSTMSTRSLLDSIRDRLDESRDLARYLIGLLVFLGLLGTFWGLLETIGSVRQIIAGMTLDGTDVGAGFAALKRGLEGPLAGMGTAFSSSLFGLSGSLVLGFLDLRAGAAQNRFFNELEEWLSSQTRLASAGPLGDGEGSVPAYVQGLLEATAEAIERLQGALESADRERTRSHGELTAELKRLNEQLARPAVIHLPEELRHELRLMTKTVAAALSQHGHG